MIAYHNDPAVKAKYVNRMKAHMEADNLVQGTGCTFKAYDHARGPVEIGVPETLIQLREAIFENLPPAKAKLFRLAFLEAIPVGSDLSLTWPRFVLWVLAGAHHGVLRHCKDGTRPSVEAVDDLYRRPKFDVAAWATGAAWAAGEGFWIAARDELLRLLQDAPVVVG